MSLTLYGYHYSVYCWTVRLVLAEKSIADARWIEINPFSDNPAASNPHPFNRVPFCIDQNLELFETRAITQYLDDRYPCEGALQPTNAPARARMQQLLSITDNYVYPALVRGVFEQEIVVPKWGLTAQSDILQRALTESARVLATLEGLVAGANLVSPDRVTLADLQLAPMIAYFSQASAGAAMLREFPKLEAWWRHWRQRPSLLATDPGPLPEP